MGKDQKKSPFYKIMKQEIIWQAKCAESCLPKGRADVCVWRLISDVLCLMSQAWCLMSDVLCLMSYIWCLMSEVLCLMSYFWYLTSESDIRRLTSDVWNQTSENRNLTSDVWYLSSLFRRALCGRSPTRKHVGWSGKRIKLYWNCSFLVVIVFVGSYTRYELLYVVVFQCASAFNMPCTSLSLVTSMRRKSAQGRPWGNWCSLG